MNPTRRRQGHANTPAKTVMHASYAAMTAVGFVATVSVKNLAMVKNKGETNLKETIHESLKLLF